MLGKIFDFFSKKELNWKGIPIGGNIENFIGEDFDILIDLNNYYNVPLRYLLVKSNAKLKVGPYSKENESFFDLMIYKKCCKTRNFYLINYILWLK